MLTDYERYQLECYSYDDIYDCWLDARPLPARHEIESGFRECGAFTDHGFGFHAQRGTTTDYIIGWPIENEGWAVLIGSYDLEDEGLDCHIPEGYLNGLLAPYGYSSLSDLRSVNGEAWCDVLTGIIAKDQEENRFEVPHIYPDASSAARLCTSLRVPVGRLLNAMERARAEYEMHGRSRSPENPERAGKGDIEVQQVPTTADLKTMLSGMAGVGGGQDPASRRHKV